MIIVDNSIEIRGHVRFLLVDREGREYREIISQNLTTFLGANMISQEKTVTHFYLEHADPGGSGYTEGSLNGLSADRSDDITVMRTSPRDTVNAESPILFTSFSTTDDSKYDKNAKTYTANFNDPALDGRIIVGAGLVVIDNNIEVLHSHAYVPGFIKPSNRDIIGHWTKQLL